MKLELVYAGNYKPYIFEYLTAITSMKSMNDDNYDIIIHKNYKYHFYQFHDYLNEQSIERLRHTRTSEDDFVLLELQREELGGVYRENTCNQ